MSIILKKRTIKLNISKGNHSFNEAVQFLESLKGIVNVEAGIENTIVLSYDLNIISLEKIEEKLNDNGFVLSDNILNKIKRGWIHYTEENEYENVHHTVHSCCEPPGEYK